MIFCFVAKYSANIQNEIELSENDTKRKQGRYWNNYQSGYHHSENIGSNPRNEKDELQKQNGLLANMTKGFMIIVIK